MSPPPKPSIDKPTPQPPALPPAQYIVPRRFNLPAVFVMTTLLAIVCGILKASDAPEFVYLFLAIMTAVTCGAQIYAPKAPRAASVIGGVITLSLCVVGAQLLDPWQRRHGPDLIGGLLCAAPMGALAGYIVGTLAASVFLITDQVFRRRPPT